MEKKTPLKLDTYIKVMQVLAKAPSIAIQKLIVKAKNDKEVEDIKKLA